MCIRDRLEGDAGIVDLTPIDAALQAQLQVRQVKEAALAAARDQLEGIEGTLRALEEERMRIEQDMQPARARIEEVRLKEQAALLQEQQYAEQLQAVRADPAKGAELNLGGARPALPENPRLLGPPRQFLEFDQAVEERDGGHRQPGQVRLPVRAVRLTVPGVARREQVARRPGEEELSLIPISEPTRPY